MWWLILNLISCSAFRFVPVFDDPFANLDNWVLETKSGHDTGNNELEHYTSRSTNIFIRKNDGAQSSLVLHAKAEEYEGYHFTSGRVHSKKSFGPYGFFNIRATVPKGEALWPAIWLLPVSGSPYGTWASCGEIDIMETINGDEAAYATLHFGQPWPKNVQYPTGGGNRYPHNVDWRSPHWFGVNWQPDSITFYLDATIDSSGQISGGSLINKISSDHWFSANSQGKRYKAGAPFDTPFNIILNLAIGGNWPCGKGSCAHPAVPAELEIFNVQVFEKQF